MNASQFSIDALFSTSNDVVRSGMPVIFQISDSSAANTTA
jgi:hypothetical protein